jgi:DNA polymerase III epsilon subunit-like protein
MREIVLDTETTGFDPLGGHRIVEIGAVELLDRPDVSPLGYTFRSDRGPSIMTMSSALAE